MSAEHRMSRLNAVDGFEPLESRRLFSGSPAATGILPEVTQNVQINAPLVHVDRPVQAAAYRAAAENTSAVENSGTVAQSPQWTTVISVVEAGSEIVQFAVSPIFFAIHRTSPGDAYGGHGGWRGRAGQQPPPAASQNGPTAPPSNDADDGAAVAPPVTSGESENAGSASGSEASTARARANAAAAQGRVAAETAVAAMAAATTVPIHSRAPSESVGPAASALSADRFNVPERGQQALAAGPSASSLSGGARASFSSSLIGITSFLPASAVVPADGARTELPAEESAAAEQAVLARAAGKSLPDRLYYFARIDPVRAFADSLAAFANDSAQPQDAQHASSAFAWGVTAVVGLADAAVLAWWHASRRRESKRRELRNYMRHYYRPQALVGYGLTHAH